MRATLSALFGGTIFGAGLALSDMIDPTRVLGFLDVAGRWDPTLACVMAGAALVSALGYAVSYRLRRPVFETSLFIPENRQLDGQLIAGATLLGIGWGVVGFCPDPAIASLIYGFWQSWLFVVAMLIGMALQRAAVTSRRRGADADTADGPGIGLFSGFFLKAPQHCIAQDPVGRGLFQPILHAAVAGHVLRMYGYLNSSSRAT
jgi:uncharacterized membrane protein YedE/YeeE